MAVPGSHLAAGHAPGHLDQLCADRQRRCGPGDRLERHLPRPAHPDRRRRTTPRPLRRGPGPRGHRDEVDHPGRAPHGVHRGQRPGRSRTQPSQSGRRHRRHGWCRGAPRPHGTAVAAPRRRPPLPSPARGLRGDRGPPSRDPAGTSRARGAATTSPGRAGRPHPRRRVLRADERIARRRPGRRSRDGRTSTSTSRSGPSASVPCRRVLRCPGISCAPSPTVPRPSSSSSGSASSSARRSPRPRTAGRACCGSATRNGSDSSATCTTGPSNDSWPWGWPCGWPSAASDAAWTSPAVFDEAVAELGTAVSELRQLAHGIRPSCLDDGLAPALSQLVSTTHLPIVLRVDGHRPRPGRRDHGVLRRGRGDHQRRQARRGHHDHPRRGRGRRPAARPRRRRRQRARRPRPGSGLAGLADRVGAHGGRLSIESRRGAGTTIEAVLPCAS